MVELINGTVALGLDRRLIINATSLPTLLALGLRQTPKLVNRPYSYSPNHQAKNMISKKKVVVSECEKVTCSFAVIKGGMSRVPFITWQVNAVQVTNLQLFWCVC